MARIAELDDLWRRAAADLDNLRKRNARLAEQQRADERDRVAAAWLPVVDNLDLALEHADADPTVGHRRCPGGARPGASVSWPGSVTSGTTSR